MRAGGALNVLSLLVRARVVGGMLADKREADDDGDSAEDEGNDSVGSVVVSEAAWAGVRLAHRAAGTYWATVWKVTPKSSSSIRQISSSSMSSTPAVVHLVIVGA